MKSNRAIQPETKIRIRHLGQPSFASKTSVPPNPLEHSNKKPTSDASADNRHLALGRLPLVRGLHIARSESRRAKVRAKQSLSRKSEQDSEKDERD